MSRDTGAGMRCVRITAADIDYRNEITRAG
jgi:hypothetical protein